MFLQIITKIIYKNFKKTHAVFVCIALGIFSIFFSIFWIFKWECANFLSNEENSNINNKSEKVVLKFLKDKDQFIVSENSIFFLYSACNSSKHRDLILKPRHACAVETAARLHLDKTIYMIYVFPCKIEKRQKMISALMGYKNIHLFHIEIYNLLKNTPLENSGKFNKMIDNNQSIFINKLLKFIILWKYGGLFLNWDILLIRHLENFSDNFLVARSGKIDDSIMKFNVGSEAKTFLNVTISKLIDEYENFQDDYESSEIITDCLKHLCGIGSMSEIIAKNCSGIKIYPPTYFMPYRPEKWKRYFDEDGVKVIEKITRSYGIRLWENKSRFFRTDLDSSSAFVSLAKKYCPQIVKYSKGFI